MKKFGYTRKEKLKFRNDIKLLFEKGKWKSHGKLRLIFFVSKEPLESPKVGVSVSKRYFKKAVDRNRIKRLLRECYRHHKTDFAEKFGENSLAMLFWNSSEMPNHYEIVEKEFLKIFN